ncbi:MAG: hypothetical protein PHT07_03445 [Paludibacter sp.]|nr:hypothetical protein [Paludibacter sp.]
MKKITFLGILMFLSLFSFTANSQIYFDLSTVGGSISMGYDAVNTEQAKAVDVRWITAVSFPGSNTSGKCSSVTSTFNIINTRSLEFWLAKCDVMVINANIATGRGITYSIDGASAVTLNGTNACNDFSIAINKEVPCKIKITGINSSSAYVSLFNFSYTSKTTPSVFLTSGSNAQTLYQTQTIKSIVYQYAGTAISGTLTWTGTNDSNTPPDGITVTTNTTAKTITISGALNALGTYGYSVTSTDGTNTTAALTGTLNTKTTTKYKMAYISNVTSGAPAAGDLYFINGFSNNPGNDGLSKDFDLTYINATDTGIDYSIYDVILESSIPASGSAGLAELKTKCLSKPFVNMKEFQLQASAWAWGIPANTSVTTIVVPDAAKIHPMYSGITFSGALSNEIILTTATSGNMAVNLTAWSGTPTPVVPTVLSSVKGITGLGGYFEIPVGTTMNGMSTPTSAKQIVLGLSEATFNTTNLLTADAIALAVNAAKYVIAPVPTISLTSGSSAQTKLPNTAITNVIYTYGGTVSSTNIIWTGTANSTTAPDGITVTTDGAAKTISISGTPTTEGVYGYTVSATDGALAPSLSGLFTITINTGVQSFQNSKTISSKEFFDITGKKVNEYSRGLLIEKSIYTDGSNSFKKVYRGEIQQ